MLSMLREMNSLLLRGATEPTFLKVLIYIKIKNSPRTAVNPTDSHKCSVQEPKTDK